MEPLREINVVRKPYRRGRLYVALGYPSVYEAAIRSLSVQMLYFYLNSFEEIAAERFVVRRLSGAEPPALSLEGGQPLEKFWLIVVSVHYEPDYVNIVRLLRAGGIHLLAEEREQVVVVGGPPIIANPEPLSRIADVLVAGEIESAMPILVEEALANAGDKRALLDQLDPERGFYVPSRGDEEVTFSYSEELPLDFHPAAQVQPEDGRWRRTTIIEVSRGCEMRCRFCMEGHVFMPKRDRPLDQIARLAREGSKFNRSRFLTLISLSLLDHPEVDRLLQVVGEEGFSFSIPSLRIDALTSERLQLLARGGQRTLVLAPETADWRLSLAIGKPLNKERLFEIAEEARRAGFGALKLYFMVGLPGERKEDVRSIAALVRELSERAGFRGQHELKLSVSVFVPKPQTPMQWFGMEDAGRVRAKLKLLKSELGGIADLRPHNPAWAYVQCVLSRGGAEVTDLLLRWASHGGGLGGWRRAARESGLRVGEYLRSLSPEQVPPWSKVKLPHQGALTRSFESCLRQLVERG